MIKIKLLKSLEDLCVNWVAPRRPKDDIDTSIYLAVDGPIVVEKLIQKAITRENARIVKPAV